MKTTTLGVKVDEVTRKRLESLGEVRQRSAHWLVKEAIKRFLEEEEAADRMRRETLEAWEAFNATGEHVPHEDMERWLKSWGSKRELPPPTRRLKWPR